MMVLLFCQILDGRVLGRLEVLEELLLNNFEQVLCVLLSLQFFKAPGQSLRIRDINVLAYLELV